MRVKSLVIAAIVALAFGFGAATASAQASQPLTYPLYCAPVLDSNGYCVQHAWTYNGTTINPAQGEHYLGCCALSGVLATQFAAYVQTYFGKNVNNLVDVYGTFLTWNHNNNRVHAEIWLAVRYATPSWQTNLGVGPHGFRNDNFYGVACRAGGDVGGTDTAPTLSLVEHSITKGACLQYMTAYRDDATGSHYSPADSWIQGAPAW